ncbi:MAG TPA: MFS transporter, partial [Piscinibacter sp.]|nr:MFS transporter [Piscinibacter sp.]
MSESLLRHRAFMRFWFARLAGTSANQMLMVAIGWQMYDLTASAWDLGLVGLMQFMPSLLLVLVAGHVLDRYHRARILAACMALQAAVAAALALAAWQGWASRDLLLALSVLIGTAKAFQLPAQQSITPLLVPVEVLPRALAFSSAGMQGAIIAGPAIGGFVYVAGAPAVYASCTALFMLSCAMVLGVRYAHVARIAGAATLDTLLAGVRFVRQRE